MIIENLPFVTVIFLFHVLMVSWTLVFKFCYNLLWIVECFLGRTFEFGNNYRRNRQKVLRLFQL